MTLKGVLLLSIQVASVCRALPSHSCCGINVLYCLLLLRKIIMNREAAPNKIHHYSKSAIKHLLPRMPWQLSTANGWFMYPS